MSSGSGLGCCCGCNSPECGRYRFNDSLISPINTLTTISISGNHPGSIVVPTSYYAGYQTYSLDHTCLPLRFQVVADCCASAIDFADYELSANPIWTRSFCCQSKASVSYDWKRYRCCCGQEPYNEFNPCFPSTSLNKKLTNFGTYSYAVSRSCTFDLGIRYRSFGIQFYSGSLNGCCGVWVEACLTWQRYGNLSFAVGGTGNCNRNFNYSFEAECTNANDHFYGCANDGVGGGGGRCVRQCSSGNGNAYPACPEADPPTHEDFDNQSSTYYLVRWKFFPGDPECTLRSLPFSSLVLTEADNVIDITSPLAAPRPCAQSAATKPNLVFIEKLNLGVASCEDDPDLEPPFDLFCNGLIPYTAKQQITGVGCDPNEDLPIVGAGLGLEFPSSDTNCPASEQSGCYAAAFNQCGSESPLTKYGNTCYSREEVENYEISADANCSLPDCRTLIYGELQDTWTISITPI